MLPLLIVIFLVGLAVGYLLGAWQQKRQPHIDTEAYEQLQAENAEFKARVNQHFDQSSEMFRTITEQYVKLYNHMSQSATELYDERNTRSPKLDTIEVRPAEQLDNVSQQNRDTTEV